jgi:hypothetical protein
VRRLVGSEMCIRDRVGVAMAVADRQAAELLATWRPPIYDNYDE